MTDANRILKTERHLQMSLAINECAQFLAISIFFNNEEFQAELTELTFLLYVFQVKWIC
jgi:hypothetical protein